MSSLTNFEKIKTMSVEEMAEFLDGCSDCECCTLKDMACDIECHVNIREWLELEV